MLSIRLLKIGKFGGVVWGASVRNRAFFFIVGESLIGIVLVESNLVIL